MRAALHLTLLILFIAATWCTRAHAWIYPEHREISERAWQRLPPDARKFFEELWTHMRSAAPTWLCSSASRGPLVAEPSADTCLDFADWPALAGDHACSPDDLFVAVQARWAREVASVSTRVERELAGADSESERENVWVTSNLALQERDENYVGRASANNSHFLLPTHGESLREFLARSTQPGAPLNALGMYAQYHIAALRLAALLQRNPADAKQLARYVLTFEASALHFLQDMFASGHVVGTWGASALRKGTHDYYCQHGYATDTWSGTNIVAYGDAHMQADDLDRASRVVAQSLLAVYQAAQHAEPIDSYSIQQTLADAAQLDSCKLQVQPGRPRMAAAALSHVERIVADTPRPGRGPESAALPRFHAEFGPFLGLDSGLIPLVWFGGYGSSAARGGSDLYIALTLGYALEGVIAAVNTGTMYLQFGLARQNEQLECESNCGDVEFGSLLLPRVPARTGLTFALRLPFWIIPGDLIVLAPVLAIASPAALKNVAMRAASGGLIPWQRTLSSSVGYWEFVIGRVVEGRVFGWDDRMRSIVPADNPDGALIAGARSLMLIFPLIEYTPTRIVSQQIMMSLRLQLGYAIDIPFDTKYYHSDVPAPQWTPAHAVWLKVNLEARGFL